MAGEVLCQLNTWSPDDLVEEILCRLPVKSLMRFKCINKSWCNLIKDSYFISKHFQIFNETNTRNGKIDLLLRRPSPRGQFVSLLSFDPAKNTSSLNFLDLKKQKEALQIMGPCNGIYCVFFYNEGSILFINPAMREYMTLPNHYDLITLGTSCRLVSAGFGFDPKANDYKVVKIIQQWSLFPFSEPLGWHAEIYTLSSNSWRKVRSPLPSLKSSFRYDITGPIFVQGATHWLVEGDCDVILAFHIVDDVFKVINVKIETNKYGPLTITKFKDSLALIYDKLQWFELWIMEEYGKQGSWTKHLIIEHNGELEIPVVFFKDDRCLLFEDVNGSLVCYDLKTQEVINLGYREYLCSIQGALYEESLISLRRDSEQTEALVSIFDMVPQSLFDYIDSA